MTNRDFTVKPPEYPARLTIPAREALEHAGNFIDRPPSAEGTPIITLRRPPTGLVIVWVDPGWPIMPGLGIRLEDEPPFPHEHKPNWWDVGAFVPCPTCGAALVWFEAGYVPGWRICLNHHMAQLSHDGRSAESKEG